MAGRSTTFRPPCPERLSESTYDIVCGTTDAFIVQTYIKQNYTVLLDLFHHSSGRMRCGGRSSSDHDVKRAGTSPVDPAVRETIM